MGRCMKCRIQISLAESNYWEWKIPLLCGDKSAQIQMQCRWMFYLPLSGPSLPLPPYHRSFLSSNETLAVILIALLFVSSLLLSHSFLSFSVSLAFFLPPLCSFFTSLRACHMRTKNGRLFPLHYHRRNLIYGAHRVERPIKSLFTVKQRHRPKPCWCFKCCWHKRYEVTVAFESGVNNEVRLGSPCEFAARSSTASLKTRTYGGRRQERVAACPVSCTQWHWLFCIYCVH